MRSWSIRRVARERIHILLRLAKEAPEDLKRRYVRLAHKIRLRYKVRFSKRDKILYCKRCFSPWILGETVRVRLRSRQKVIEYECTECGYIRRFGYRKG